MITAEQVKDILKMANVAEHYGVRLDSHNKALCPFHADINKSFSIKNEKFKCFGCGATGDIVDFVSQMFNLSFREALIKLNDDFRLGLSKEKPTKKEVSEIEKINKKKELAKEFKERKIEELNNVTEEARKVYQEEGEIDKFYELSNIADSLQEDLASGIDISFNANVFDKADFIESDNAFYWLSESTDNPLQMAQNKIALKSRAKEVGISSREFDELYKSYNSQKKSEGEFDIVWKNQPKLFDLEYIPNIGEWNVNPSGIFKLENGRPVKACTHPICINKRMINIENGECKVELKFSRDGKNWKYIVVNKNVIATATTITSLNEYGVSVTSNNARLISAFLQDFEDLNYSKIEEVKSVNRFGWFGNKAFIPYSEGFVFDSESNFLEWIETLKPKGDIDVWIDTIRAIRSNTNEIVKIVLASSFSSVLIGKSGYLPFVVHMWGDSGSGKTVALKLAASVWGNPSEHKYLQSFDSTAVAQETISGLLHSLPLIMDELQIVRGSKNLDTMVHRLTQKSGRARGTRSGGLREIKHWQNCTITSGEQPISSENSGGGVKNRLIELPCTNGDLFDDPVELCEVINENYGEVGKLFINELMKDGMLDKVTSYKKDFYKVLLDMNITAKQAASASIILAADNLINELIFNDGQLINIDTFVDMLQSEKDISINVRAYDWLKGWIVEHGTYFTEHTKDRYGKFMADNSVAILKPVFDRECQAAGYSPRVLKDYLMREDLIEIGINNGKPYPEKQVKIDSKTSRCIILKATVDELFEDAEEVPF